MVGGHGRALHQTVVGLLQGAQIAERENHGEAAVEDSALLTTAAKLPASGEERPSAGPLAG